MSAPHTTTTWIFACSHRLSESAVTRLDTPDSVDESPTSTETLETPDTCPACRKIQLEAKAKHEDKLVEFRKEMSVFGKVKRATALHVNTRGLVVEFAAKWKSAIVSDIMTHAGEKFGLVAKFEELLQEWGENVEVLWWEAEVKVDELTRSMNPLDASRLEAEKQLRELQWAREQLDLVRKAWLEEAKMRLMERERAINSAWEDVVKVVKDVAGTDDSIQGGG
jgi:dsDNA-specific endonuclease/ATPase MutS2